MKIEMFSRCLGVTVLLLKYVWGIIFQLFQVSAVANNGLCMPIFRQGDSCSYKLLRDEAQQGFSSPDMWKEIRHRRILKAFLWRYGISIVLTGMIKD
jgi:hypothetical protein